jgi:hypothetical protein
LFTNDYIMRMIEQLVLGIALIMGLKKENKTEEAAVLATDTLRKFFGLNDKAVEELPWENLMSVVSLGGAQDLEKCALLGQLIKEKADLMRMQGNADASAELSFKALNLLLTAVLNDDRFASGANMRYIEEIIAETDGWKMPEDSKLLLFRYYRLTGHYGKAEDTLYDLLQSTGNRGDILEEGLAFYQYLMGLPDSKLQEGNLPRNEVNDGYEKLLRQAPR